MGLFNLTSHVQSCNLKEIFNKTLYCKLHIQNNKMSAAPSGKGSGLTKPMKVSADLAEIIGMKEASRAQCIKMLWKYLKDHNLQDPENKQYFFPDKKMGKIFGQERIRAFGMAKFLGAHLTQSKFLLETENKYKNFTGQRHINHQKLQIEKAGKFRNSN